MGGIAKLNQHKLNRAERDRMVCEVYAETQSFQEVTRRCGVSRNTAKKVWNELTDADRDAYMSKAKERNNDNFALDNTPKFAFEINRALHNMSFALRDICSPMNLKVMDVREFCDGKIARYKIPKYIFFIKEFPMTGSGKIQKFKLKDLGLELCAKNGIEII